ncbi:NAD(+) salvage pathway protein [Microsporum canis]|uniref:nicotinamidase n=1 Tax=Arthroderma otae (strain ATCC MYA-4605 / CBS 113480) TaxID=554155 RepID=C5FSL1_ARTOC|nr:pyrazinamidase/nicotinamidase [Microsporum canis CBS 113480]EEQ32864.1 pyrazinamidase/nicotinamidase [Microsporum canis CBS 113480]
MEAANKIRPALIVVDMQEDFCPPDGSLAVQHGRSIAPLINKLLSLPGFVVKIGTQDFHPSSHISFATNHPSPSNIPFISTIDVKNPATGKEEETKPQRLWPAHCVQGTKGANLISEIESDKLDAIIRKGMDERVEMYSPFADAFGNRNCVETGGVNHDLEAMLNDHQVSDVFVVGIAGDYCVKFTAIDAADRGFRSYVIDEATKSVDPGEGWEAAKVDMAAYGVRVISADGIEEAINTLCINV